MNIVTTELKDIYVLEPKVFQDERGYFFESYNQKIFEEFLGREIDFVQDNQSLSKKGVLRGLHYQVAAYAQAKLVRVLSGEIFDVAVDLRRSSKTFGKYFGTYLSSENKKQLWIPEGFAHGFYTTSDSAEVIYKASNFYNPNSERTLFYADQSIEIDWPLESVPILATKDLEGCSFAEAELFS